jgi:hypothetical protein
MVWMANLVILVIRVFLVGIQHIGNEFELFAYAVVIGFPTLPGKEVRQGETTNKGVGNCGGWT